MQISFIVAVSAGSYMSGTRRPNVVVLPAERIEYAPFTYFTNMHRYFSHSERGIAAVEDHCRFIAAKWRTTVNVVLPAVENHYRLIARWPPTVNVLPAVENHYRLNAKRQPTVNVVLPAVESHYRLIAKCQDTSRNIVLRQLCVLIPLLVWKFVLRAGSGSGVEELRCKNSLVSKNVDVQDLQ